MKSLVQGFNLLDHLRGVSGRLALLLGHAGHLLPQVMDRLRQGLGGYDPVRQPLLQRVTEALRVDHQLVKGVAALSGHLLDGLNEPALIGDALVQQLLPAGAETAAEQFVSRLGGLADHAANGVGHLGQHFLGFLKVANQDFPCGGPAGLSALLQGVPELGKGLDLGGGVLRRLRHLGDVPGLGLRESLLDQVGLAVRAGKLLQGLGKHFCGEPLAFGEGLPEGAVHIDGVLRAGAQQLRGAHQGVLEHLAAHTGVDHRVPVHQGDLACGQGLGELVHGCGCLLGGGARDGRQVGDTLDGVHRGPQVDAGRGERADVPGHLGKVVDGLIRVGIQLIQGPVHLLEVGPLVLGVGQDGLHRPDLGLILLKTRFNGVDYQGGHEPLSRVHRRIGDVGKSRHGDDLERRKFGLDRLHRLAEDGHVAPLRRVPKPVKALGGVVQVQSPLEFVQRRQAGLHVLLELPVIKPHFNDSLVDRPAHDRVTSFQAYSAIWSKIGWIAGLM